MIKIVKLSENKDSFDNKKTALPNVDQAVEKIINTVIADGDKALYDFAEKFDKVRPENLIVTQEEIESAVNTVGEDYMALLSRSAANIEDFHRRQVRSGFDVDEKDGIRLGQRVLPLDRVGVYVPGGTASYPSSVLMNVIPAKLAGVKNIVITTPPDKNGSVSPNILAAAYVAKADIIVKAGGAQAIAALAYGTESVPAVDKIVGPGNLYVATAKRMVFGKVDIDMEAGPSEILVIADSTCNPAFVAADLLSQAEHDRLASSILITDSEALAAAVSAELEKQIPLLSRCDIARESIDTNGRIFIVDSLDEAAEYANKIAPEHLEICLDEPFELYSKIKHASSVFLGKYTPEALGDYYAGPNHVLPTMGTARFASPLSVDDFVKKNSYICYSPEALEKASDDIITFAESEGLTAHAKSVGIRFGK